MNRNLCQPLLPLTLVFSQDGSPLLYSCGHTMHGQVSEELRESLGKGSTHCRLTAILGQQGDSTSSSVIVISMELQSDPAPLLILESTENLSGPDRPATHQVEAVSANSHDKTKIQGLTNICLISWSFLNLCSLLQKLLIVKITSFSK